MVLTRSRALWFAGVFVLVTPILLVTFRDGGELTGDVWALSTGTAALAIINATIFGKSRRDRPTTTAGPVPAR